MKRRFFPSAGTILMCMLSAIVLQMAPAFAAAPFPTKGLTVIVGYGAGSGSDQTTRAFMPIMSKYLGQPITVINQEGAGGVLSWNTAAKAKPDGYTIIFAGMPSLLTAAVMTKVEYDPLKSFDWLGTIVLDPVALCVKAGGPYKTMNDFVEAAKKNPGKVTIGATGRASTDYTIGVSIETAKGVKFNIVNFDGTPQGIAAVLGDNLSAMGMNGGQAVPYEKAGQLLTLGVGGDKPFPGLGAPTFKSLGINLFTQGVYRTYMVPKGVPADIYDTLVKAFKAASDDPQWKESAAKLSLPLVYHDPKETFNLARQINDAAKEFLSK